MLLLKKRIGLYSCISYFILLIAVTTCLKKASARVFFTHIFRVHPIIVAKAGLQEFEAVGHSVYSQEPEMSASAVCFFIFVQCETRTRGMVPLTVKVGLPTSVNSI